MDIIVIVIMIWFCFSVYWRLFCVEKKLSMIESLLNNILSQTSIEVVQIQKDDSVKKGNRKSRTDEQREAASQRRKEWWANKKASETKIPDAIVEIAKEN